MGTIRTFVAVKTSNRIHQVAEDVIERLASTGVRYKWVDPENMHVTLKFVGDVRDTDVPELCRLMKQGTETLPPFTIRVAGVGAFPSLDRPRTIWLGVEDGADEMKDLHRAVEDVLSYWGVNKDRHEFCPHLTIGRLSRGESWNDALLERLEKLGAVDAGYCEIESVKVYSSHLDRSGPSYTSMATIPLKGPS